MELVTTRGTYTVDRTPRGFYRVRGSALVFAVYGPDRSDLVEAAVRGNRTLTKATDPSGLRAVGFSGSTATLNGCPKIKAGDMVICFTGAGDPVAQFVARVTAVDGQGSVPSSSYQACAPVACGRQPLPKGLFN